MIHEVPAIEHRQRQQVQHRQTHRDAGEEVQEGRDARACRLAGVVGDRQRSAQVLQRRLTDQDAAEQTQGRGGHVPALHRASPQAVDKAAADQHTLGRRADEHLQASKRCAGLADQPRHHIELHHLAATFDAPSHRTRLLAIAGTTDRVAQLTGVSHGAAVDAEHAVARLKASPGAGATGGHAADQGLLQGVQADLGQQARIGRPPGQPLDVQLHAARAMTFGIGDIEHQAFAQGLGADYRGAQRRQRLDVLPLLAVRRHRAHPVACLQPGPLGQRTRGRRAEQGLGHLAAQPRHNGKQCDREQPVRRRTGGDDGRTLTQRPLPECLVALLHRHRAVALVQHPHIATERQRAEREFGAIAPDAPPQHMAKANRKPQHLDAAGPRHPVVAPLVHRDQHGNREQERGQIGKAHTRRLACVRVRASSSSRASMLPQSPGCTSARHCELIAWIRSNRRRPFRKASTATSLAALSTAVLPSGARSACQDRCRPGKRSASASSKLRLGVVSRSSRLAPEVMRSGKDSP
mmetsp:Transcript_13957/g.38064  ORF Transcript_13957/g.38064 Transcript_13957/m.38064 type:complete len:522 (-) Transcript_13957:360-1925(-)